MKEKYIGPQVFVMIFAGCVLLGLILWVTSKDSIEDKHRHQIEQLGKDAELARKYSHVSELKYCIRNVKTIDSLLEVIDKMLWDKTMSYEHQKELIDIRSDLDVSRTISNTPIIIESIKDY